MKIEFKWQLIHGDNCTYTHRAKVIGGWIINQSTIGGYVALSESMVFIPDPNHEWEI